MQTWTVLYSSRYLSSILKSKSTSWLSLLKTLPEKVLFSSPHGVLHFSWKPTHYRTIVFISIQHLRDSKCLNFTLMTTTVLPSKRTAYIMKQCPVTEGIITSSLTWTLSNCYNSKQPEGTESFSWLSIFLNTALNRLTVHKFRKTKQQYNVKDL